MIDLSKNIAIIDTSSGVTGAFVSGQVLAEALSDKNNVEYRFGLTNEKYLNS